MPAKKTTAKGEKITISKGTCDSLKEQIRILKADQAADHANYQAFEKQVASHTADLQGRATKANEAQRKAEVELQKQIVENNNLRDLYQQSLLTIARLEGYLQAVEEQKPPVMVPAEQRRMPFSENVDFALNGRIGGYGSAAKPWYHRP